LEKLDLKDRKILYHLDIDSRQSFRSIGKKTGLSKDIVASRIKKLKERGIIKQFYTVIDSFKLGYIGFRFYLVFQRTNPEKEKEIIDYFVKNKYVWWVCGIKGQFDLAVAIWVRDIIDFDVFWEKTLQKYRYYFQSQVFSVYLQMYTYKHSYILLDEYDKNDRLKFDVAGLGRKAKTDELDFKILKMLAKNSRIPTIEIAKKLNSTSITINNRVKRLTKLNIIQGFRVILDFSKLGYQWYKADVRLMDYNKRGQIINYIIMNPHLFAINKTAGYADLELDFFVDNVNQLLEIIEDLKVKFPNAIKNYTYFYESEFYKLKYIPEE
jgi:Lrp/AsnC family transcriptional regulator for asnA, asnC and gidA